VINSKFGKCCFVSDIAAFFSLRTATPTRIGPQICGNVFPIEKNANVVASKSDDFRLTIRVIV